VLAPVVAPATASSGWQGASDFMERSNPQLYRSIKPTTHLVNTLYSNNSKLAKNVIRVQRSGDTLFDFPPFQLF
jgi:hypothetical protein